MRACRLAPALACNVARAHCKHGPQMVGRPMLSQIATKGPAGPRLDLRCHVSSDTSTASRARSTPSSLTLDGSVPTWEIRMLYDGDCPLCMKEVDFLKRRDDGKGRIDFVDIASDTYSPALNAGLDYETAMGEIHAILPDGSVVRKLEVFRRLYEAVDLGWVYAVTKIKAVEAAANAVYDVWAKYRLPVTGRPDLVTVLENRANEGKNCKPPKE